MRLYTSRMLSYLQSRSFLVAAAASFLAVGLSSSAQADTFSGLYVFGDSLSDVGNAYHATGLPAPPYSDGRFSNGNVWVQDLAPALGLPAPTASSLSSAGTDYAVGGAETGNANPGDLSSQLTAFKTANPGGANPTGLYIIWIGSNDLNAILSSNPTPAVAAAEALAAVGNIDNAITTLAGDGAKDFLVLTVPDLGKTPAVTALGAAAETAASGLSLFFDQALVNGYGAAGIPSLSGLAGLDGGLRMSVLDTYSLLDTVAASPAAFGLTNVTQPCLTGEVDYAGGTPCANPNSYLFWDQLHPTAAGQSIVAAAALQAVPEPASLTMLFSGAGVFAAAFARHRRNQTRSNDLLS